MRIKPILRTLALILLLMSLLPTPNAPAHAGGGSGGGALMHDSNDDLYRTPGGAVPVLSTVTLRLRATANNVDSVTIRVWNERAQEQTLLPMQVVATTPEGYDLWEASLDVGKEPTIYWYRFIVQNRDGSVVYYEDDFRPARLTARIIPAEKAARAGLSPNSPDLSWQITVYDPEFYTPEWMRNAVIYQIFPDRFRDGDPANDPADDSLEFYDGLRSIFHETWNEPPVDPRQPGESIRTAGTWTFSAATWPGSRRNWIICSRWA